MIKGRILFLFLASLGAAVFAQIRSFDGLYPALGAEKREAAYSPGGLEVFTPRPSALSLLPAGVSGLDIAGPVLKGNPRFVIESVRLIPYAGKSAGLLEIYNGLGKIRDLKGRLYHSATRDRDTPLFEDATRIEGPRKTTAIPDPPPASAVPGGETIYIRLKDVNFGNSYYRAEIGSDFRGLLYTLSNFRNLSYLFIPIMKEEKFVAQLYFEPVAEGILLYSAAAAEVSDFAAAQADIPSAIRKRLELIIGWARDGISAAP
jgi:hypothetical protein